MLEFLFCKREPSPPLAISLTQSVGEFVSATAIAFYKCFLDAIASVNRTVGQSVKLIGVFGRSWSVPRSLKAIYFLNLKKIMAGFGVKNFVGLKVSN